MERGFITQYTGGERFHYSVYRGREVLLLFILGAEKRGYLVVKQTDDFICEFVSEVDHC